MATCSYPVVETMPSELLIHALIISYVLLIHAQESRQLRTAHPCTGESIISLEAGLFDSISDRYIAMVKQSCISADSTNAACWALQEISFR